MYDCGLKMMVQGATMKHPQAGTEFPEKVKPLSFVEMLQSALWALLGVQKQENRARDFARGNPWHFIFMGVGFTFFFVCLLLVIVQFALGAVS